MCLPYRQDNGTTMISADGFTKREATLEDRGGGRRPPAEMLHLLSAVVVWLVTGSTISSLNKWIFAVFNFRYPLLLSALHMLTAIVVDYGLIKLRVIRHIGIREQDLTPSAKCKVFMLSLTFCASIAFGNMGLNYVQLSFAQMIYTTTPIFTLAISTLVLGKQHHILKYTAMMPICLGASFSIMGEVQFDQTGCLFVFAATMLRGVKSIQQSEFPRFVLLRFWCCRGNRPQRTVIRDYFCFSQSLVAPLELLSNIPLSAVASMPSKPHGGSRKRDACCIRWKRWIGCPRGLMTL